MVVCTVRKPINTVAFSPAAVSTYQQHPDGHHGSGSRGDGAVHQDHVVLADVSGQPQVMQLSRRERVERFGGRGANTEDAVTKETK